MKKRDKIICVVVTIVYIFSLIVGAALVDDRIIRRSNFTAFIVIALIALVIYYIYLLRKHLSARKKANNFKLSRYKATMNATLKHISGLPIAKGLFVEMFYGPESIVFRKDGQEITISKGKITSIDIATGASSARKVMSGAATGKYVLGGKTGAAVGALSAISTQLVISYTSDGKNKSITLDTASSGMFASKVVKDFQQTSTHKRSKIEL